MDHFDLISHYMQYNKGLKNKQKRTMAGVGISHYVNNTLWTVGVFCELSVWSY